MVDTYTYICRSRTQRRSVRSEGRADWRWLEADTPHLLWAPANPSFILGRCPSRAWLCSVTALGTKRALSSSGHGVLSPSHAVTQFYNHLWVSEVNPAFQSISREKIYEISIFRKKITAQMWELQNDSTYRWGLICFCVFFSFLNIYFVTMRSDVNILRSDRLQVGWACCPWYYGLCGADAQVCHHPCISEVTRMSQGNNRYTLFTN